ncbi:right-handed parallel beta-helix repeat-containing protein [Paenibacillus flagellatus]|uniref:Uncharacterized protein n=1 Tax=Paenibacillus flagellatus TaxID=2211139 RepID=A0A2V5KBS6_9BACL|nr:right-handed parallel beta-helix repeat-containing protein [Paenibacillus flagellatus]PYI56908.1 hypothetical protein DLM86_00190 [Paenibacillus flagellatus]
MTESQHGERQWGMERSNGSMAGTEIAGGRAGADDDGAEGGGQALTRRKLLGALGAAGVTLAAGGAFVRLLGTEALASGPGVTASVYGTGPGTSVACCTDAGWANVADYGAAGDGTADDTAAFRAAAATGKPVLVPATAAYYKLSGTVSLTNSIAGVGMPEIRMDGANGSLDKRMFRIAGYRGGGLSVSGLYLNGGYSTGTAGEHSHHIHIADSRNVYVHHNWLHAPYGDCVYVGSDFVAPSENVHIRENVLSNPRRCAVAIVSGRKVWVTRNVVSDPYPYVAAIDLEPNATSSASDLVEDVWIEDNEFYSEIYFVNSYNPNAARPNRRITISGNKGKASYLFRCNVSAGTTEHVAIRGNEFYGAGRMITCSKVPIGLEVAGNRDMSTGAAGWHIADSVAPNVAGNRIEAARTVAVTFANCQAVRFADNVVKDVVSGDGAVRFAGSNATSRHLIAGNVMTGVSGGGYFFGALVTDSAFDGNVTECGAACLRVDAAAAGSDLRIGQGNVFAGTGTPVVGGANLTRWTSPDIQAKGITTGWAAAVPATGSWKRGTIVWNVLPSPLAPVGWVCVSDGSPGVWEPIGPAGALDSSGWKLKSPNGTVYKVSVTDAGALSVAPA